MSRNPFNPFLRVCYAWSLLNWKSTSVLIPLIWSMIFHWCAWFHVYCCSIGLLSLHNNATIYVFDMDCYQLYLWLNPYPYLRCDIVVHFPMHNSCYVDISCCPFAVHFYIVLCFYVWIVFVSKVVYLCMLVNRWGNLWRKGPTSSGNLRGDIFWGCQVVPVSSSCIWGYHKFISRIDTIYSNRTTVMAPKVILKGKKGWGRG